MELDVLPASTVPSSAGSLRFPSSARARRMSGFRVVIVSRQLRPLVRPHRDAGAPRCAQERRESADKGRRLQGRSMAPVVTSVFKLAAAPAVIQKRTGSRLLLKRGCLIGRSASALGGNWVPYN